MASRTRLHYDVRPPSSVQRSSAGLRRKRTERSGPDFHQRDDLWRITNGRSYGKIEYMYTEVIEIQGEKRLKSVATSPPPTAQTPNLIM